jgi:glutathione synthase/RimK-type ligase-like ATP-grasp enzyme
LINFGIMTLTMESEITYFNEIANRASSVGIECFRFTPSRIDPHTQQVKGKKYNPKEQTWMDDEFPIPTILYDRCFYGDDDHSKQCIPIVSWLKSRDDLSFLGYGLPNKLELYEELKQTILSPYLAPSMAVSDVKEVLEELAKNKKLILKPINGSQGYGIYYVKKSDRTFQVKTEKHKQIISRIFPNEAKFIKWLKQLIQQRSYLHQPFLDLSNNELQPFDIRMLLQKDENGNWMMRGKGIRTGSTGGILSNLSAGGTVIDFETWSATLSKTTKEYICNEIEYIKNNLPLLLEEKFLPLFELGVDIGVSKNGSIWILDVNSKPGRKVVLSTEPDLKETLFLAPLLYGKFLTLSTQKERKNYHAKTLSD